MEFFRPDAEYTAAVESAFDQHSTAILAALPAAEVEHIGSTAVPGALTKGDLDLLVRVPAEDFAAAVDRLSSRYAINQSEAWTGEFASFAEEPTAEIPVGVQLVRASGNDDRLFIEWRERLTRDPDLLARYNDLKLSQTESTLDAYIEAKGAFIESVIGGPIGG